VLAHVVRSGFVEGRHRGSLVLLAADGSVELAVGDVHATMLPRSSNKPMQAAGMLDAGLELEDRSLLALAAASHAAEPFHVDGVRKILASAGLDESALRTPAALPGDEPTRLIHECRGEAPAPVYYNCSGKHAAMLATSARNGWATEGYLDPAHPVQQAIHAAIERLSGERIRYEAVDGCGAPLLGISVLGLARAFRACATAEPGSSPRRVADAMRAYPDFVGGTRRFDSQVMRAVPGLISKGGAEGVHASALPDGRTVAFKVEDGSPRAIPVIAAAALRRLGVRSDGLDRLGAAPLTGGDAVVGAIQAADW
jgi:L-asparaginase II